MGVKCCHIENTTRSPGLGAHDVAKPNLNRSATPILFAVLRSDGEPARSRGAFTLPGFSDWPSPSVLGRNPSVEYSNFPLVSRVRSQLWHYSFSHIYILVM